MNGECAWWGYLNPFEQRHQSGANSPTTKSNVHRRRSLAISTTQRKRLLSATTTCCSRFVTKSEPLSVTCAVICNDRDGAQSYRDTQRDTSNLVKLACSMPSSLLAFVLSSPMNSARLCSPRLNTPSRLKSAASGLKFFPTCHQKHFKTYD